MSEKAAQVKGRCSIIELKLDFDPPSMSLRKRTEKSLELGGGEAWETVRSSCEKSR